MASHMSAFKFQEYVPDKKDLCSLCDANVGEHVLVECKDGIRVCPGCIDLLVEIKKEKQAKRDEQTIQAMLDVESSMPDGYQPIELLEALLAAARENKIPRVHVDY